MNADAKDVKIAEVTSDNLMIFADNVEVSKLSTLTDTNITTVGDTKIADATVGGDFINTSVNTTISGKLDVIGDANIDANNITIADANIGGDLNADAKDVKIAEMKLDGNINATVDNLSVYTSNDLHIASIRGNTADYTDVVNITSSKDITNGLGADDTNMFVKNANLTAGNSIGENQALNIKLADGNKLNISAGNVANLNNTGAVANYNNIIANDTVITATNAVNIANLNTDKLTLTTDSENVNITGYVTTKGTIETASKDIVIDNTSLEPYPYATAQLYLTQKPMHLIVDGSNNILTENQNVVRYNKNIVINKKSSASSMEDEIELASENALRDLYHNKKVMNEVNGLQYHSPTVSDYISSVIGSIDDDYVRDFNNRLLNESNIMNIINQTKNNGLKSEKHSEADKKKKVL